MMTNVLIDIPEGHSVCCVCLGTREIRGYECEDCWGGGTHPINVTHRKSKHLGLPSVVIQHGKVVNPHDLLSWAETIGAIVSQDEEKFYVVEIRRTTRPVRSQLMKRESLLALLFGELHRQVAIRSIAERVQAFDLLGQEEWRMASQAKAWEKARQEKRLASFQLFSVSLETRAFFLKEIREQASQRNVTARDILEFDPTLPTSVVYQIASF